jgi:hypothetical protein
VEYGLTTVYGNSSSLNTSLVTIHSVVLSGLSAGNTYHYRVKSKDASANQATSADYSFTTSSGGAPANVVGTTTSTDAIPFSSRWYSHRANGYYWVAYHNGTQPVIYSSSDGQTWTSQGNIFSGAPNDALAWGIVFESNTIHASRGYYSGGGRAAYRQGALNSNGTISWGSESLSTITSYYENGAGHTDSSGLPWVLSAYSLHKLARNSQANGQGTWTATPYDLPDTGSADSGMMLFSIPDGTQDMLAIKGLGWAGGVGTIKTQDFNNGSSNWDSEITVANDMVYDNAAMMRKQWDAAKLNNNEIHLVVRDSGGRLDHYKRTASHPYAWSTVQANITGLTTHTRVSLSTDGTNLWAIYDKNDNKIYYRKWDGSSWGSESILKDTTTTLRSAIDSSEKAVDNKIGVVWVEGSSPPYHVQFSWIVTGGGSN